MDEFDDFDPLEFLGVYNENKKCHSENELDLDFDNELEEDFEGNNLLDSSNNNKISETNYEGIEKLDNFGERIQYFEKLKKDDEKKKSLSESHYSNLDFSNFYSQSNNEYSGYLNFSDKNSLIKYSNFSLGNKSKVNFNTFKEKENSIKDINQFTQNNENKKDPPLPNSSIFNANSTNITNINNKTENENKFIKIEKKRLAFINNCDKSSIKVNEKIVTSETIANTINPAQNINKPDHNYNNKLSSISSK